MAQIDVKVIDKETRSESVITYKAFVDTAYRFELLGQVDSGGNLIPGDPNLNPQHRRKSVNVTAASVGKIAETIQLPKVEPPFKTFQPGSFGTKNELEGFNGAAVEQKIEPKVEAVEPVIPVKEKRKYTKRIKETA